MIKISPALRNDLYAAAFLILALLAWMMVEQ